MTTFTKLAGVTPDRLEAVIDEFTGADWALLDQGYLEVVAHDITDWWRPMLGLAADVDAAALFCLLYQRSLARAAEA